MGTPIKLSADFFNRNFKNQKRMAQDISSDEREEPTTKNTLPRKKLTHI